MSNLVQWIEDEANGEAIEGVVIGSMGWGNYNKEKIPRYDSIPKGVVLPWEEAKKWINYEFSSGYGAPQCNAIYAWTQSCVIFIVQYDGSTSPYSVPRHPTACMPGMPGG